MPSSAWFPQPLTQIPKGSVKFDSAEMEKLTSSTLHASRVTSTKWWIKHDHFAYIPRKAFFSPSQTREVKNELGFSWCPVSPSKIITWLSCLSWLYHLSPRSRVQPNDIRVQSDSQTSAEQGFLFFFFKRESPSSIHWNFPESVLPASGSPLLGATVAVVVFQGSTPSDHEWKNRNQLVKMYLIDNICPGKNFISQQTFSSPCGQTLTTNVLNKHL